MSQIVHPLFREIGGPKKDCLTIVGSCVALTHGAPDGGIKGPVDVRMGCHWHCIDHVPVEWVRDLLA